MGQTANLVLFFQAKGEAWALEALHQFEQAKCVLLWTKLRLSSAKTEETAAQSYFLSRPAGKVVIAQRPFYYKLIFLRNEFRKIL